MVPGLAVAMPELDEADSALQKPAGRQQLPRMNSGTVHLPDRLRLLADVERVGRFRLHTISQLERLDPRLQLGLMLTLFQVPLIQFGEQVELGTLGTRRDTTVADVRDQFLD